MAFLATSRSLYMGASRRSTFVYTQQTRQMASLKDLRTRMASISGIRKITSSMKLVAASRLKAAENNLYRVRPFLNASTSTFDGRITNVESEENSTEGKNVFVCLTSDRGLCGGINSSIIKRVRAKAKEIDGDLELVIVGQKGESGLGREFGRSITMSAVEMGKKELLFADVVDVAEHIVNCGFDRAFVLSNHFLNKLQYELLERKIESLKYAAEKADLSKFEFEDIKAETMHNLFEWYMGCLLYSSLVENTAAELSARMNSMENATKNAGEIYAAVELQYNRQRQATITKELSEIVAGAEAVKDV